MKRKGTLRGRKEKIGKDWTWRGRRMTWNLKEVARKEEREGKRMWIGYGKIRINDKWWRWVEQEGEMLRDERRSERRSEGWERRGR